MHQIYLPKRMTALEIREPIHEACEEIATREGIFARFTQQQQIALTGHSSTPRSQRTRIGNGKHYAWSIDYQTEPPQTKREKCHVIGTLLIKSHFDEASRQFGGWDYGEFDYDNPNYAPTYNVVNLSTIDPSRTWKGMGGWLPHVLEPNLLEMSYEAIKKTLLPQDPLPFDNLGNF